MDENFLIERAAGGDESSFRILLERYKNKIFALCFRYLGNYEDAEDAAQETVIKIYRALPGFSHRSAFSTWVYRVVTNTCLDSHRRKRVRKTESLDALSEAGWNTPDTDQGPEAAAENSNLRNVLSASLNQLPFEIRSAVVLRDVQGFSYEEISDILQINIGTVKSRISRGREKLREMLAPYMEPN